MQVVQINWVVNPFRGDKFEHAWRSRAEAVLDYGASAYALFRSKEDPLKFTQLSYFEDKLDWDRYWLSEEISDARAEISGWYQVPLLPVWHSVVDASTRERAPAHSDG
jgi:heme-degrading monooxygenase HmoA